MSKIKYVTPRDPQGKHIMQIFAGALRKARLRAPIDGQRIKSSATFQTGAIALLRNCSSNYDLAAKILGNDFLHPEDIAKARGIVYAEGALARYAQTLPDEDEILWPTTTRCFWPVRRSGVRFSTSAP